MNEEDQVTEVMLDFYKRVQAEPRSTGMPPPFEVTSSVVTLGPSPMRRQVVDDPPKTQGQPTTGVLFEKDFYFGQNRFFRTSPGVYDWTHDFQVQCHDENAVAKPMLVSVLSATWSKPGFPGGPVLYEFFGSPYTPAQTDEAPTIIHGHWFLPPGPPIPVFIFITIQLALKFEDTGEFAETYYLFGERQDLWQVHNEGNPPYIMTGFEIA